MIHKHLSHYFSLIGILGATVVGFIALSYDKNFQLAIIGAACIAYISWGIVHHIIHKNLNLQIIIEYIMVSLIGFVICVSLIFRS